jgi:hypothetical protein
MFHCHLLLPSSGFVPYCQQLCNINDKLTNTAVIRLEAETTRGSHTSHHMKQESIGIEDAD